MLRKALSFSGFPCKSGCTCSEKWERRAASCPFCPRLGGDAPKSWTAAGLARAIFIRFLPLLGGHAPKNTLDFGPSDWVVMLRILHAGARQVVRGPARGDERQGKALIEDAFQLAKEAHASQSRDSGLPYILHQVAIRMASEKGNTIITVDDFVADPDVLYPVRVEIVGIDRYHLLQDILDCIVERHKLSMHGLSTHTEDDIVTCSIEFTVRSADELTQALNAIRAIKGVEEALPR